MLTDLEHFLFIITVAAHAVSESMCDLTQLKNLQHDRKIESKQLYSRRQLEAQSRTAFVKWLIFKRRHFFC